jgi:hypothetical protein
MTWNSTMGLISSVALFLPVFLIVYLKLGRYKTFPALLFYYSTVCIYNVLSLGYIDIDPRLIRYWGLTNNLLDGPLMMTFLIYFSTSAAFTKRMKTIIAAYIAFEAIVLAFGGLNVQSITIILGPGILITTAFCIIFFSRQTKITIVHRKATGKALIAASLLFAYGCFAILYLMYYIIKVQQVDDTILIYFLVATISSIVISAGIFLERKRIRLLNELKITRRELSDIYATEKKPVSLTKPVMLDFDREQWY